MKRSAIVIALCSVAAILVMTASCSDDDECCPISEKPVCADFLTGGAKSLQPDGQCPAGITDSIPKPTRSVDAKGCPVWLLSGPVGCGVAVPFDAGGDSSPDAADAAPDSSAPPLEQDAESP